MMDMIASSMMDIVSSYMDIEEESIIYGYLNDETISIMENRTRITKSTNQACNSSMQKTSRPHKSKLSAFTIGFMKFIFLSRMRLECDFDM